MCLIVPMSVCDSGGRKEQYHTIKYSKVLHFKFDLSTEVFSVELLKANLSMLLQVQK